MLIHNLHGHLVEHAVYEDIQASVEARLVRLKIDSRGRPTLIKRYSGDKGGTPTVLATSYTYDALGRTLLSESYEGGPGGTVVESRDFSYADSARWSEVTTYSAGGDRRRVRLALDELLRPVSTEEWPWTGSSWGSSRTWHREFDGLERMTAIEDPLGTRKEWTYDDLGRITHSTRRSSVPGEGTQTTQYTWDPTHGYLDKVTDAEGAVTDYTYDDQNWYRLTQVTHPDGRYVDYSSFDSLDRPTVIKEMPAAGSGSYIEHNLTYDYGYLVEDATNAATQALVVGPDKLQWDYDPIGGWLKETRTYDGGNLVWKTTFDRSQMGEITDEIQGLSGSAHAWEWEYGFAGELLTVTYPSGLGLSAGAFD